jgi:hypothetical protein
MKHHLKLIGLGQYIEISIKSILSQADTRIDTFTSKYQSAKKKNSHQFYSKYYQSERLVSVS